MTINRSGAGIPTASPASSRAIFATPFTGFRLPTSSTTYTPNQFFDVCLPRGSRGCVRLVGYLIRRTLGWSDADGNPQEEQISVSYSDLVAQAGISRNRIRSAIDEAITRGFIREVRRGVANGPSRSAQSAVYELRWDERDRYIRDPNEFRGFFAGEGNRTYIPNEFFDRVLPHESLAVLKVVGSVIRFSIGFQNKWGYRRQHTALSYDFIQRYSGLGDRKTIAQAIRTAIASNYIERIEEGRFDPQAGRQSRAAIYAVKWLSKHSDHPIGAKTPPGAAKTDDRSQNPAGIGAKIQPAQRCEIPTDIQITVSNNTDKQHEPVPVSVLTNREGYALLRKAGFVHGAATNLADRYGLERIKRQIDWLPYRRATRNTLGFLRSAIEGDWVEPLRDRPEVRAAADALRHKFTHPFSS